MYSEIVKVLESEFRTEEEIEGEIAYQEFKNDGCNSLAEKTIIAERISALKYMLRQKKKNNQKRIICSAIWLADAPTDAVHLPKNIKHGVVICGHRHHNCFAVKALLPPQFHSCKVIQGFLTSDNRFVTREEAKKIALKTKQCLDNGKEMLFSEDLY